MLRLALHNGSYDGAPLLSVKYLTQFTFSAIFIGISVKIIMSKTPWGLS